MVPLEATPEAHPGLWVVLCLSTEEKPPLRGPGVTVLQAATLWASGGGTDGRAQSLCGEIPPQVLRHQPADLNCPRGAQAVPETARGRRSDQGVEEPPEPRSLSRRFHALLEGDTSPYRRRTNPPCCFMPGGVCDGGTGTAGSRMHLAAAQAAPHPPGPTARIASSGAGTGGRVTSAWGSSSSCTTSASEAKRCFLRSLSCWSRKTLESKKSVTCSSCLHRGLRTNHPQ